MQNGLRPNRPPRARVLLADDDFELRSLLSGELRQAGYIVTEVGSGTDLLDRLASDLIQSNQPQFDLLVSDVRMPGWSGLEVLGGLRRAGLRLPVVLITAFGDSKTHRTAHKLGAALLDKPFDLDDFRGTVAAELGGAEGHPSSPSCG
jgi:CheY-like chemotaxis protein